MQIDFGSISIMKSSKKRIGLVTWIGGGNYGTTLQCYALNRFLKDKGYDCYYIYPFKRSDFTLKSFIRSILRCLGIIALRDVRRIKEGHNSIKNIKLRNFINKNIRQKHIENSIQYHRLLKDTDVFCVGSDQLWNAYYCYNPFNFLNFVQESKRISFAASMGTRDFPKEYSGEIKKLLNKFDHISTREKSANKAVSELTGRDDIKTVLDPTFLLTSNEWLSISKQARFEIDIPDKYILCYFIGNNQYYTQQIENVKKKIGITKVIDISIVVNQLYTISNCIKYDGAGIAEFIWLIENSSWICTDSFHGTAISINLKKNFTELLRFKDTDKNSQNSRIYDILNVFRLQDRIYNKENCLWAKQIDYKTFTELEKKLRRDSAEWLINSIEH